MSKGLKIMLFWSVAAPVMITIIRIIKDYFMGEDFDLISYSAIFLGFAFGGVLFMGPINYFISKSKGD
ncbi:hypothetical protein ACFSMW_16400 [Virgibacillus halophilus]|uniref:Uncharacterized protein n=1 Tax=Tigheibacillus halophilus TaxID=361280 RepID=A0ABU5C3M1_9BACI|nr:hypothetical protein [Virgibacillus halophilus]